MDYWPEIIQVLPTADYKIYLYFDDGTVRLFDARELLEQPTFRRLKEQDLFTTACTVIGGTLAWTPDMSYSDKTCLDLDPGILHETCPTVECPL